MFNVIASVISFLAKTTDSSATGRRGASRFQPHPEVLERRQQLSFNIGSGMILYNPTTSPEPYAERISLPVTNGYSTKMTYQLSVNPPSAVSFSQNSGTLGVGTSTTFVVTPTADSKSLDDVHILIKEVPVSGQSVTYDYDLTIVSVTFGTTQGSPSLDVKNTDTPTGMPDRIPPTATTPLYVHVTPDLTGSADHLALGILGQNSKNGTASINGLPQLGITSSGTVNLKGISQTAPTGSWDPKMKQPVGQYAGNLRISVIVDGLGTLQSNGFSIAAIPVGLTEKCDSVFPHTSALAGIIVDEQWTSDSGHASDLDAVDWLEEVQVNKGLMTGVFIGKPLPETQTGWLGATTETSDNHAILRSWAVGPGSEIVYQTHVFRDRRTGASGLIIANSGYTITRKIWLYKTEYEIETILGGLPVTANGFSSAAGGIYNFGKPTIDYVEPA